MLTRKRKKNIIFTRMKEKGGVYVYAWCACVRLGTGKTGNEEQKDKTSRIEIKKIKIIRRYD